MWRSGDEWIEAMLERQNRELEKKAFEGKRLCGKNAHAYKAELDNLRMLDLWGEGKTLREIAQAMGCSPSTVKNRLDRLLGRQSNKGSSGPA